MTTKFYLKYSTRDGQAFSSLYYDTSVKAAVKAIIKRRERLGFTDIICIKVSEV